MRRIPLAITTIFVVVLLLVVLVSPLRSAALSTPLLRLHRGTFDAQSQAAAASSSGSPLDAAAAGPYAIIQLRGPVTLADRQALLATGIELLEYLPDYAFLVSGSPAQISAAARLPQTYARVPFTLADKLAPGFLAAVRRGDQDIGEVQVVAWPNQEVAMGRALQALPFAIGKGLTRSQLLQVAALESVRWIEQAPRPHLLNNFARTIMGMDGLWQNAPLYGNGQIIGITDTGLDTGNQGTLSPDFAGRVVATQALTTTGNWADEHGHGTHVAGSAAGAGVQSGANPATHSYTNSFAGMAPEAQLSIQGFEVNPTTGEIIGIPSDYYQLFNLMYATGARLHSNSWGDYTGPDAIPPTPTQYGGYVYGTRRTDEFIWDHPDMTVFAAAGNNADDGNPINFFGFPWCLDGNGVMDPDSLLSPGTAKNVITVGASETTRSTGGYGALAWGDFSLCFYAEPIFSDSVVDDVNGMAAFSSRGPADDGRMKPDITAPGVNIISNRSHAPGAGTLWGAYDANYSFSGGTSMATPLTAGGGALVREWLQLQGATVPSAALVKATMLNTTVDLAPGQYGTGAYLEIPFTRPNIVEGWGRFDVGFMDPPAGYALWFDDGTAGLNTGDTVTYTHSITQPLQVFTTTQPLRAMLVWTDPPASLSARTQLVNDLDLVLTGPGGSTYYGNGISGGDRLNNVEGIVIGNPPTGQYTVTISAFNVPTPTQPYALVVAGPLRPLPRDLTIGKNSIISSAAPGDVITYTLSYQNIGSIAANGAVLTETVPANTTFNAARSDPAWSCVPDQRPGSTCTLSLGSIAGQSSGAILFTVNVSSTIQGNAGQIVNTSDIGDDGSQGADPSPLNNTAGLTTPLVNVGARCGLTSAAGYVFSEGGRLVTVTVNTLSDIACLQVRLTNTAHPSATLAMKDGWYWTITANNASGGSASGYNVDLSFPHTSTNTTTIPPRACRHLGAAGWDCGGTQGYNASIVLIQGVTSFSDWTVAYKASPTALDLQRFSAGRGTRPGVLVVAGLSSGLATLSFGVWRKRTRRKRRPAQQPDHARIYS